MEWKKKFWLGVKGICKNLAYRQPTATTRPFIQRAESPSRAEYRLADVQCNVQTYRKPLQLVPLFWGVQGPQLGVLEAEVRQLPQLLVPLHVLPQQIGHIVNLGRGEGR